jgi:hypothetical protein
MIRSSLIAFWTGTACILLGLAATGYQNLLGSIIGYWTGFGYTVWVYYDTLVSSELDTRSAISRMRRGFFSRLGMVTLVVIAVYRFQKSWLLTLALGIAVGLIVSFITVAIQRIYGERGEEKSG